MRYRLREMLEYQSPGDELMPSLPTRTYPGVVDGEWLKREIGARMFQAALDSGVLVPEEEG